MPIHRCFHDLLHISQLQEVGGMTLFIETDFNQIQIHTSSSFSFDNIGATNFIFATCDKSLNVIEEERTETLCYPDKKMVGFPDFLFSILKKKKQKL